MSTPKDFHLCQIFTAASPEVICEPSLSLAKVVGSLKISALGENCQRFIQWIESLQISLTFATNLVVEEDLDW